MTAEFEVSNGLIYASNFQVNSNEMVLVGNGNLDFSGNLDFTINAQLNQQLIDNSPSLKKTITSFLSSATNAIVVKVSGTLQNPQYSIVPMAGEIIKKIKEFFTEDILR